MIEPTIVREPFDTAAQTLLRGRVKRLEEAVADVADETGGQTLLRGRVKRLEDAVSDIQDAQSSMDHSLRILSLASLTIKRALADVVRDLSALPL